MTIATPEQRGRANIDQLLEQAGWAVQYVAALNVHAARSVAVRESPLRSGHGAADYLLYVDSRAAGVVAAKPIGHTLTGVDARSGKYGAGLPDNLPRYIRPLSFLYESTGAETRFTNGLDPQPRSRNAFSFHTPNSLAEWLGASIPSWDIGPQPAAGTQASYTAPYSLSRRLTTMPPLDDSHLWSGQAQAIRNLEQSLARAARARWCRWPPAAPRPSWPATRPFA